MPRCIHCGKTNREDSLFCQDCGQKLEAPAPKPNPMAMPGRESSTCPACSTVNPPGMNFCKMCGAALAPRVAPAPMEEQPAKPSTGPMAGAVRAPAVVSSSAKAMRSCPACGKPTPGGFSFCQHCGHRILLAKPPVAQPAEVAQATIVSPTPPAGQRAPVTSMPLRENTQPAEPAAQASFGRLVLITSDGKDGAAHSLIGDSFDVGRTEGSLIFPADLRLAARHARFTSTNGTVRVRSLDLVNGVYMRLQEPTELASDDMIIVGKELLRFEMLMPAEMNLPQLMEHGVCFLGSAPRESWGRLRQLSHACTTRDVWHLARPEFVIGREEGDVTFPDDEFMSRVHVIIRRAESAVYLDDKNSSNGTYLRLRNEQELRGGEILRLGDQLLRFEAL